MLVLLVLFVLLLLLLLLLFLLLLLQLLQSQLQIVFSLLIVGVQAKGFFVSLNGTFKILALEKGVAQIIEPILSQTVLCLNQSLLDLFLGALKILLAVEGVGGIVVRLGQVRVF